MVFFFLNSSVGVLNKYGATFHAECGVQDILGISTVYADRWHIEIACIAFYRNGLPDSMRPDSL